MFDAEGREVPGNRGYKYFGAAKDLPGVRELFEQEPPPPPRKTRAELMKDIDADYYGYRDDDDGVLIPLEEKAEKIAAQEAIQKWKEKQGSGNENDEEEDNIYGMEVDEPSQAEPNDPMALLAPKFTAHVPVPTQKDIEEALLRKKKQDLLEKYGLGED